MRIKFLFHFPNPSVKFPILSYREQQRKKQQQRNFFNLPSTDKRVSSEAMDRMMKRDGSLPTNSDEPLIPSSSSTSISKCYQQLKMTSFGIGLLVGISMHLSTLGLKFIVVAMLSKKHLPRGDILLSPVLIILVVITEVAVLRLLSNIAVLCPVSHQLATVVVARLT